MNICIILSQIVVIFRVIFLKLFTISGDVL